MGMGGAFVALSGDASAPFWNPAATATIDRTELMAFHSSLFLGTNYDCIGVSQPLLGVGVFSISAGRIGTDDIERRDEFNRKKDTFSSSESQLGIGFARNIGYGFIGGVTLKAVSIEVAEFSGSGMGADLGFQFKPSFADWLTFGAAFNDLIQPRVKLMSVEDKYQTVTRLGLASSNRLREGMVTTASFELEKSLGRDVKYMAGAEFAYRQRYFIRLGYNHDSPTFGAGLIYRHLKIDYAYENIDYLGGSHRISFGFSFGKSVARTTEERRARIAREERDKLNHAQQTRADSILAKAKELVALERYHEAMRYYQRAFTLNSDLHIAKTMADSMMSLIIAQAVEGIADRKREELISGRIESALKDHNDGLYNGAISKYSLLLEIDPENKTIVDLLKSAKEARQADTADRKEAARTHQDNGDYAGAVAEWSRVIAYDKNDGEASRQLEILKRLIKADNLMASAVAFMDAGNYIRAARYLERAQALRPDDKSINTLLREAKAKSAPSTTLEDIKANPEHWSIYLSGLESYQSSDYSAAISAWEKLREFYPNNPDLEKNIDRAKQRLSTEGGGSQD